MFTAYDSSSGKHSVDQTYEDTLIAIASLGSEIYLRYELSLDIFWSDIILNTWDDQ
jgi:hypothetical protein